MNTKVEELRKLAEAATPGPWKKTKSGEVIAPYRNRGFASVLCCVDENCGDGAKANLNPVDTDFIAAANPQTVIAMCALLEQMRDALVIGHQSKFSNEALAAFDKFNERE